MRSITERIYYYSPYFIQNLWVNAYGLRVYLREYGKNFRKTLEEFERMQWYSCRELEEYQNRQLKSLIKHCYENVPYYNKLFRENRLTPDDIGSIHDLHKLPILTKDEVKANVAFLIARNFKRSKLVLGLTSGTTGSPLEFYYDNHICIVKNVVDWRHKRLAAVNVGDRIAMFWGRVVVPGTWTEPPFWRYNWMLNQVLFSSYHLSVKNLKFYIRQLQRFAPKALEGYPSTLYVIALHLLSLRKTLPVKAVFTSSEALFPHQRETIEQAFECKVFDFYGLAERVVFATECAAHHGLHLNMDFGITEILNKNGEQVAPGEVGKMVATGLHNFAMPLIRYETNDVTVFQGQKCTCGRETPLIGDLTTRAEDMITTREGRYISFASLTLPIKLVNNIGESQIIQEDLDHIRIRIVRRPNYAESDTQNLLAEFRKRIGADMKVEVEFVGSIPRSTSGKFRFVISKVPLKL